YIRIAMGANTTVTSAAATSTQRMSVVTAVPCIRPRAAVVRCVTGFSETTVCSQPGMVAGSTKMLLMKVIGNSSRKLVVITDSGVRTSMPTMIHSHETAEANTNISAKIGRAHV